MALLDQGTLIKWPRPSAKVFSKAASVIAGYLALLRNLDVTMPETQVFESPEIALPTGVVHVPYCMTSTAIQGHHLKRTDLARPEIRSDLAKAIAASKRLESSGLALDLFGCRTAVKLFYPDRTLGNNLIASDEGLFLVDPSLRVLKEGTPKEIVAMKVRTSVQHALGELLLCVGESNQCHLHTGHGATGF